MILENKNPFPYKYICIEGNIGAGKTSFCHLLKSEHNCKLILEEFDDNPFLPLFYDTPERFGFTLELFFMTERYKQMEHELTTDLFSDFTVADYTFMKTLLFARKNLKDKEYKVFQKMFTVLEMTFPKPELLVYFHRNVDILMDNIKRRGRNYESKISARYLEEIQNSYFEYFRNILSFPVLIIDLKDIDFVSNPRNYEDIKYLLTKKYQPGVHRASLLM
jgi:deoxyguanosine kinase